MIVASANPLPTLSTSTTSFSECNIPSLTTVAVENGNVDKAIRKLKKKLQKEDFFNEIRKREYYETRNERKRKERAASTRRCIRKIEKMKAAEV